MKARKSLLVDALKYRDLGFSVIAVGTDKKPLGPWKKYQERPATAEEIEISFNRFPDANIGVVTGKVSKVSVFDCDTNEAWEQFKKIIPDGLLFPVAKTPREGRHAYFADPEGKFPTKTGIIPGLDVRGQGGYVIVPPSRNVEGNTYKWLKGRSLFEVAPPPAPLSLYNFLYMHIYKQEYAETTKDTTNHNDDKMFEYGRRDNDLFHTANILTKGGMPENEIVQVLERLIFSWGETVDEKWVRAKVASAMTRSERRERNIAAEVREWVLTTKGYFLTTESHKELQLTTKQEMKACNAELARMFERGEIERRGDKRGCFRVPDKSIDIIDWRNASTEEFKIDLPLNLSDVAVISPKNVIIIAGSKSAGKTAVSLDIIKRNCQKHDVVYLTSELVGPTLRQRIEQHGDVSPDHWTFTPISRHADFSDLITAEKKIWVIDYIEEIEEPWKVAVQIKNVFDKLVQGVAIICLQKNPGTPIARGGAWTLDKAGLYVAFEQEQKGNKAKIVDCKSFRNENPRGKILKFKLVGGWKFLPQGSWRYE